METFWRKSKTGLRDWTKMEFMRGDINAFIERISGYKSTISVGLGTVNMYANIAFSREFADAFLRHAAKISKEFLKQYNEMIQDTAYNLELYLQRIDEKMEIFKINCTGSSDFTGDLNDEREVTKQCLRVCEDARHVIESIGTRESFLFYKAARKTTARKMTPKTMKANASKRKYSHAKPWMKIEIAFRLLSVHFGVVWRL